MADASWYTVRRRLQKIARERGNHFERGVVLKERAAEAVLEAREAGLTMREIADLLAMTRVRVYQLLEEVGSTSTLRPGNGS